MTKKILIASLMAVFCFSLSYAEEKITITTYYPSPNGSYNELSSNKLISPATSQFGPTGVGGKYWPPALSGLIDDFTRYDPGNSEYNIHPIISAMSEWPNNGYLPILYIGAFGSAHSDDTGAGPSASGYAPIDMGTRLYTYHRNASNIDYDDAVSNNNNVEENYLEVGRNMVHTPYGMVMAGRGGNVGIGTIGPEARLHVYDRKNIYVPGGNPNLQGTLQKWSSEADTPNPNLALSYVDVINSSYNGAFQFDISGQSSVNYAFMTGNVGIGTISPVSKLHIEGAADPDNFIVQIKNTTASGEILRGINDLDYEIASIRTDPGHNGFITVNRGSDGYRTIQLLGNGYSYFNGGNVGIGTTDPGVENKLKVYTEGKNAAAIFGQSEQGPGGGMDNNVGVKGQASGWSSIGVSGFATGTASAGVYGNSNVSDFFAVHGVYSSGSCSIRWKKNIKPIDNPVEKIEKIRGVYYDLDNEHGGKHTIGVIAEEVQKVFPEIVTPDSSDKRYAVGLDYGRLTAVLIEAVKEQQKQIDSQGQAIENLKKEIKELKAKK